MQKEHSVCSTVNFCYFQLAGFRVEEFSPEARAHLQIMRNIVFEILLTTSATSLFAMDRSVVPPHWRLRLGTDYSVNFDRLDRALTACRFPIEVEMTVGGGGEPRADDSWTEIGCITLEPVGEERLHLDIKRKRIDDLYGDVISVDELFSGELPSTDLVLRQTT